MTKLECRTSLFYSRNYIIKPHPEPTQSYHLQDSHGDDIVMVAAGEVRSHMKTVKYMFVPDFVPEIRTKFSNLKF